MNKIFSILFFLFVSLNSFGNTNNVAHFTDSTLGVKLNTEVLNHGIRTVDFWFKPQSDINPGSENEYRALIARDSPTQNGEWGFFINNSTGKITFFRRIGTTLHEIKSNDTSWNSGQYYHVTGVIDSTNGMFLYIDNNLQNDGDSSTAAISNSFDDTYIGKWGSLEIRHFKGYLDNVRMWSRALTPEELSALSCDLIGNQQNSLQLWLKMEELDSEVLIAKDASKNEYNCQAFGVITGQQENVCILSHAKFEELSNNDFTIYPNPATTEVNVFLNFTENFVLTLTDMSGKLIERRVLSAGSSKLKLMVDKPGLYFVLVTSGREKMVRTVVVH